MRFFKTEQGSTYFILKEGNTLRYKVKHEDHDPTDFGFKRPSRMTVYVDFDEGLRLVNNFIWGIRDILITSWALYGTYLREGKLVLGEPIYYDLEPTIGKAPFEVWGTIEDKGKTFADLVHIGTKIISIKEL